MRVHEPLDDEMGLGMMKKHRGMEMDSAGSLDLAWDSSLFSLEPGFPDWPKMDLDLQMEDFLQAPHYDLPAPMELEVETEEEGAPQAMDVRSVEGEPVAHARVEELTALQEAWHKIVVDMHRAQHVTTLQLQQVHELQRLFQASVEELEKLRDAAVLSVSDVFTVHWLINRLQTLNERSKLVAASHVNVDECVKLVFTDVPLPKGFKNKNRARSTGTRKKQGHVTMTAEVFCAPGVTFQPSTEVRGSFYRGDQQVSIKLQNNEAELDDNRVRFNFRFPAGTRNKPLTLRLEVEGVVRLNDGREIRHTLVSNHTNELIVTTNECQWERAEEKILRLDVFQDGPQAHWGRFVNALQVLWARCTRQESESGIVSVADRPLMRSELDYFARHFFPDAPHSVTEDQVEEFFKHFGPAAHVFRHNVTMRTMLMSGVVWGFIEREEATRLLEGQEPGTFLVRTGSSPSDFCISLVDQQGTVRHSKVDAKTLLPPISNFADMLGRNDALLYVLSPFVTEANGRTTHIISRVQKDDVLGEHYSSKPKERVKKSFQDDGYADMY